MQNQSKREITFDTQLKIALFGFLRYWKTNNITGKYCSIDSQGFLLLFKCHTWELNIIRRLKFSTTFKAVCLISKLRDWRTRRKFRKVILQIVEKNDVEVCAVKSIFVSCCSFVLCFMWCGLRCPPLLWARLQSVCFLSLTAQAGIARFARELPSWFRWLQAMPFVNSCCFGVRYWYLSSYKNRVDC